MNTFLLARYDACVAEHERAKDLSGENTFTIAAATEFFDFHCRQSAEKEGSMLESLTS